MHGKGEYARKRREKESEKRESQHVPLISSQAAPAVQRIAMAREEQDD